MGCSLFLPLHGGNKKQRLMKDLRETKKDPQPGQCQTSEGRNFGYGKKCLFAGCSSCDSQIYRVPALCLTFCTNGVLVLAHTASGGRGIHVAGKGPYRMRKHTRTFLSSVQCVGAALCRNCTFPLALHPSGIPVIGQACSPHWSMSSSQKIAEYSTPTVSWGTPIKTSSLQLATRIFSLPRSVQIYPEEGNYCRMINQHLVRRNG